MRHVPARSPWLQLIAVFGSFLLGPWAAIQTSARLTPGSEFVQTAGALAFVLVFSGGTLLWAGLGILKIVSGRLWRLARGRAYAGVRLRGSTLVVQRGYGAFVVLGIGAGFMVGVLAGVVSELTIATATAAWTTVGGLYGVLLWLAAHHGYFPFGEPE
jgi:hypothetical protein